MIDAWRARDRRLGGSKPCIPPLQGKPAKPNQPGQLIMPSLRMFEKALRAFGESTACRWEGKRIS